MHAGDYNQPIQPELPLSVRQNCYSYLVYRLGTVPSTSYILSHLSDRGQIIVFYYKSSGLYHYALADSDTSYHISETHMYGDTFSRRDVTGDKSIIGRFNLEK